jgi:hypothetical protein
MGGSRSQPKKQEQQQEKRTPSRVDPVIAYMATQQQQQTNQAAAEAERQRQAQIEAQIQSGSQAKLQGEQYAMQSLGNMNVGQQVKDQSALATQNSLNMGGGFDVGAVRQSSLQQMGAGTMATPMQPGMGSAVSQAANIGAGGTQQRTNQFQTPSASGLTFGGA